MAAAAPAPPGAGPTSWVAARLVREFWPDDVDRASHPEVETVRPEWNIYMSKAKKAETSLSRADLKTLKGPGQVNKDEQYAIPSDDGLIFFIRGPSNAAEGGVANVQVRWGANSAGLALISTKEGSAVEGQHSSYRVELSRAACGDGWCDAVLPISKTYCTVKEKKTKKKKHLQKPPKPGAGYCPAGKAAIEVCTHLMWKDSSGETFLSARLEHHLPARVAWAGWWLKEVQVPAGPRGYAAEDATSVEVQATAAKGWMLATAEVMVDSGWALAMKTAGLARVKFMGFETNNPMHEDHEGIGSHWHLTVRHLPGSTPRFTHKSKKDPTPHLYFADPSGASPGSGKMDVSGTKGFPKHPKQRPAVLSPAHGFDNTGGGSATDDSGGIERLEGFATFLEETGSLTMAPLIALQSARASEAGVAAPAKSFLHVRTSWASIPKGQQFQLSSDDKSGSHWGIEFLPQIGGSSDVVVALRSAKCGGYLHARRTSQAAGKNKWEAFMLHREKNSPGSQWIRVWHSADGKCSFESVQFPGKFLHVRRSHDSLVTGSHKEQVFQLCDDSTSSHRDGNMWRMQAAVSSLLDTFHHSYNIAWTAGPTGSSTTACQMVIKRDDEPWRLVDVDVNSEAGAIVTSVRDAASRNLVKAPLRTIFDPLTGNVLDNSNKHTDSPDRVADVPTEWYT